MANGDPPIDCPACEAKIIVNGDTAAQVLAITCERIDAFVGQGNTFPNALKLVKMANDLEDQAFAFQKEVLSQMGFKGPWPKSMRTSPQP